VMGAIKGLAPAKCQGTGLGSRLFIDGANSHANRPALGFDIDYQRLLTGIPEPRHVLVRALYYTAIFEDQEYSSSSVYRSARLQCFTVVRSQQKSSTMARAPQVQAQHGLS